MCIRDSLTIAAYPLGEGTPKTGFKTKVTWPKISQDPLTGGVQHRSITNAPASADWEHPTRAPSTSGVQEEHKT